MPMRKKFDTLSQGVFRRLHNTHEEVNEEDKVEILEKYMLQLKVSGYNKRDRYEILKSGIDRYENLKSEERRGKRPFYRSKNYERKEREESKKKKKTSWFKDSENNFKTVFFVPPTPNNVLLRMLKRTEERHKIGETDRIKFVETAGRKYIDFLKSGDQFRVKCTPKEDCLVCKRDNTKDDCKAANVGYSIECNLCKSRSKRVSYEGETARNCFLRQKSHLSELRKKSKKSALYKHVQNEHSHEEEMVDFSMKIVGKFTGAMNRIIEESVRIRNKPAHLLLNSKAEFHGPVVKRKVYESS